MTREKPRMAPSKAGIYNLPLNFAIIQICPEHLSVSELAQAKYVCQWSIPNETHVFQSTLNLVISRCCFGADGKEM